MAATAVEDAENVGTLSASLSSEIAHALAAAKHESVSKSAIHDFFTHPGSDGRESDLLTKFTNGEALEASKRIDTREEITMMSPGWKGRDHLAGREARTLLLKRNGKETFMIVLLLHDERLPDLHS